MSIHTETQQIIPVDERLRELRLEFDAQIDRPQGGDPRIGAFFASFREVFDTEGLEEVFTPIFERRPELNAIHAAGLCRQAIQKQALRRARELRYPELYLSPEPCVDLAIGILRDPAARREFIYDITNRNVQTNEPERGKSLKPLSLFTKERFGRPPRIVDFGCSQNHVLKKLVMNGLGIGFRYRPVSVRQPVDGLAPGSPETADNPPKSQEFNTMLEAGRLVLGRSLGIDKESNRRRGDIEWVRSSWYASELLDETRLEEFDLIETTRVPNVGFRKTNILDMAGSTDARMDSLGVRPFDIAFSSAMFYQLTPQQRRAARQVMINSVDPENGLVVYQDFARVSPETPTDLEFFDHWDEYTFRTIVEDMRNPGVLQEIFLWRTGRCTEVQLGLGHLSVGQTFRPAEDLFAGRAA